MKRLSLSMLLSAPFLLGTAPLPAQVTTIDAGGFTITQQGQPIGREQFSIRSTPSPAGPSVVASATVAYSERRVSPTLEADRAGQPRLYQVEVKLGGQTQERLKGTAARGRFSAQVRTPRGESAKEYIVSDGALILDDEVFHQYYFLGARSGDGTVPVVIPRRSSQVTMRVETVGTEPLVIGGQTLQATHLVMTEPAGARRDIWLDSAGRVLKVALPARGIVALRDDPPR